MTTLQETYNAKLNAIELQLLEIQKRVKLHSEKQEKDPKNWGYVGDIENLLNQLINLPI